MYSHSAVFLVGAGMALVSLLLSFLVPRHPDAGQEVTSFRAPLFIVGEKN
jgi:hypothetical protein